MSAMTPLLSLGLVVLVRAMGGCTTSETGRKEWNQDSLRTKTKQEVEPASPP